MPKRPRPDLRPSWRSPSLPCIRNYTFGDGTTKTEIPPDYERRYREHLLEISDAPDYKSDPTYHMSKRKPK